MAKRPEIDKKAVLAKVAKLLTKLPVDARPRRTELEKAIATLSVFPRNLETGTDDLLVFAGDLTVKGSFVFGTTAFILGNLTVDGVLHEHWHGAHLVVGGNIEARGIKCGSSIHALGGIVTEALFVETSGTIGSGSGLRAELVILEDRKFSKVSGKLTAAETVVLAYPDQAPLEKLRSILTKSAFTVEDPEQPLFSYEGLLGSIRRRKPWRAEAGKATKGPKKATASPKVPKAIAAPAKAKKTAAPAKAKKTAAPATAKKTAAPATAKKTAARRFELVDGSSRKFWEISTAGVRLTTRYGRIGADGQSTTKTFGAAAEASAMAEKLAKEKVRKGYVEKP